ncbi:large conductance mechanosensitive channel protein MscL [bacterium]|nr:large conductance mechanosensitive channel protein MscL [bacterium]
MKKPNIKKLEESIKEIDTKEVARKATKKTKGVWTEFRNFAFKDSTISMAVGIMIGAGLKSLIDSIVTDILTPPIGKLISGIDLSNLYFVLGKNQYESLAEAKASGAVVITYGNFLNQLLSFLITAFVLFIIVKESGRIQAKLSKENEKDEKAEKKATKKTCPYCKLDDLHLEATKCPHCGSTLKD